MLSFVGICLELNGLEWHYTEGLVAEYKMERFVCLMLQHSVLEKLELHSKE